VEDYLLTGSAYAYINRIRNTFKSLHYIDPVSTSIIMNTDPIFKSYTVNINGTPYRDYEFIKITRKTKNGATGIGIVDENNKLLSVSYNSLLFEENLVKTGGNKKGFLRAQNRISQEAIDALKTAWNNLYRNNSENVMILNNGLDFVESSNTSVELQLHQNKVANSAEICKIFNVPLNVLEGKATEEEYNNFIKVAILPILKAIETSLNKNLLLDKEKGSFYFAFDSSELLKGDIEKRYKAYEIGVKNGILQVDEVRYKEDLPPLGLEFIKLGLADVLYDPKTKTIYTPNTNQTTEMDGNSENEAPNEEPLKEVNKDESGDSEQPSNS
jgi:HK97 family phage portal protein